MFITFEGLDFCGKSTQVKLLHDHLAGLNKKVKIIREPGGTPISEKVREILLDKKNESMFIETEVMLFSASRSQLVREIILPHLKSGYYVISDRFHDSTIAYQGFGRGLHLDFVSDLQKFIITEAMPDITFFIDIPIEEVLQRKARLKEVEIDRIESSKDGFYAKVREGYLFLAGKEDRFRVINGLRPIEEMHEQILREINKKEQNLLETKDA